MADRTSAWPALLSMLQQSDEQAERTMRGRQSAVNIFTIVSFIMTVALIGWALVELRDAWHTNQWGAFWDEARNLPLVALVGTRLSPIVDLYKTSTDNARRVREAAIRGDERDAPIAQEHILLPTDSGALFGSARYGPLKQPPDGRVAGPIALLCIAWFMAGVMGIIFLVFAASDGITEKVQAEQIFGGIIILLLLLGIWPLVFLLRLRRGIFVTVDDRGISWRHIGWRARVKRISWHDAQAFFLLSRRKSTNWAKEITWVLMSSDGALAWTTPQEATPQTDTPHARFAALIATQTRLPLRDLSALAHEMTSDNPKIEKRVSGAQSNTLASTSVQTDEALHALPATVQPQQSSSLGWGCTVQLVLMLVILLLYAGGWGLQHYQPQYYTNLLTQIHMSKPLYHDDLTYDDGDWYVTPPTEKDSTLFFKDSAYHATGTKDNIAYAWPKFEHDDASVEVTARQIGTTEYDGVGLVLHVNENGSDKVVFYVDSHGLWWLWNYRFVDGTSKHDWTNLDEGYSSAIHIGAGAVNRLLVLMHSNQYICYVNGRIVDMYRDEQHETPSAGHMGIYLNDGATEGVFTDFTVYPAPPQSIFSML